jgi:hypothetical protein
MAAHLDELYRRIGLFVTEQVSLTLAGRRAASPTIKRGMAAGPRPRRRPRSARIAIDRRARSRAAAPTGCRRPTC